MYSLFTYYGNTCKSDFSAITIRYLHDLLILHVVN